MNKKVIIIGLGIGKLYESILPTSKKYKFNIITVDVDPNKNPTYTNISNCLEEHTHFDLGIICTPNYLHDMYANILIPVCDIVLVEKPGLKTLESWKSHYNIKNNIFVIKNNMFRDNLLEIRNYITNNSDTIKYVELNWLNKNRIPSPGSWFTEKQLAWGGVSSDLIPHLLSIYYAINLDYYVMYQDIDIAQNYTLDTISDTEYGAINKDGVYDVDDSCKLNLGGLGSIPFKINACWKNDKLKKSDISVRIVSNDGTVIVYELDLCPGTAYLKMVETFLDCTYDFKDEQNYIDCWIHKCLDQIREVKKY